MSISAFFVSIQFFFVLFKFKVRPFGIKLYMLRAASLVVKLTDLCEAVLFVYFFFWLPYRKILVIFIMFLVDSCFALCWMFVSLQILRHLENRQEVHREAIDVCKDILQQKHVDWEPVLRNDLSEPITNVDLVVTVGGDGTLLRASHFLDESIPILGVNSDPTQVDEVTV